MSIYKPYPSQGFKWSLFLMVFIGVITAAPIAVNLAGKPNPGFIGAIGLVFVVVVSMAAYFAWASKNMRYELDDKNLVIKWAFNKKVIPLANIDGFGSTVGTSSTKVVGASLPGFHLGSFTNPLGKGSINLFATRLWGEILLIRTKWEIIGITPEDSAEFIEELHRLNPGLEADNLTGGAEREVISISPWKEKHFLTVMGIAAVIMIGTALYLYQTIPTLPARIPMHYNLAGEVDRYGSPNEVWMPFGIGALTVIIMNIVTGTVARNNRTTAYLMAYTSVFLALLFSIISIGMTK